MNAVAERKLLDRSCANALANWVAIFQEMNPWSNDTAYLNNKELPKNLADSVMPNYNNLYIPPAYVVRYQLGHIYMAKVALDHLDKFRPRHQDTLSIIDFGSGTSACRIATALMVADSIKRGQDLKSVEVVEIDNSICMRFMGNLIWQEFVKIVESEFANSLLAQAVQTVSCTQTEQWDTNIGTGTYTWLTAFHALYPDYYDLGAEIERICEHIDPALGVFSCHSSSRSRSELARAFPLVHKYWWFGGNFPKSASLPDGRVWCPSYFIAQQAKNFGLWPRIMPPFLQTKSCALLWGSKDSSITTTPVFIAIP